MYQGEGVMDFPPFRRTTRNRRRRTSDDTEAAEFESNDSIDQFDMESSSVTSPDEEEPFEEEDPSTSKGKINHGWSNDIDLQNIANLKFTGETGIVGLGPDRKYSPLDFFKLFVDNDLIQLMVNETNKNARANFVRYGYHEGFLSGWLDISFKEMSQFLGLIIFMSFKRFPDTNLYWSTERLYFNSVSSRVFTQTRFHRILAFWHFGTDGTDSVYAKVNPVINRLNDNFKKYKQPGNIVYVGRSHVFLRNKYIFEPQAFKDTRKGSKILKVMDQDVYTYRLKILGPCASRGPSQTKKDVMEVLEDYLDSGRLIIFHNIWMSVELAEELLKRKCHSIGMIRKNCRGTPKELQTIPVEEGDLLGYQNACGVSVMKWQGPGSSMFGITTCHTLETVPVQKKTKHEVELEQPDDETIPKFLQDISLSEKVFDAQEKFNINTSPINDRIKWYQRLACDAIVNAATTNALILFRKLNKEKIKMWDFRDRLFRELIGNINVPPVSSDEETEEPDLDEE